MSIHKLFMMYDFLFRVSATHDSHTYCHTPALHDARPIFAVPDGAGLRGAGSLRLRDPALPARHPPAAEPAAVPSQPGRCLPEGRQGPGRTTRPPPCTVPGAAQAFAAKHPECGAGFRLTRTVTVGWVERSETHRRLRHRSTVGWVEQIGRAHV